MSKCTSVEFQCVSPIFEYLNVNHCVKLLLPSFTANFCMLATSNFSHFPSPHRPARSPCVLSAGALGAK